MIARATATLMAPTALTAGACPALTLSTLSALTLSLSKGESGHSRSAHSPSLVVRQAHHEGLRMRIDPVIAGCACPDVTSPLAGECLALGPSASRDERSRQRRHGKGVSS